MIPADKSASLRQARQAESTCLLFSPKRFTGKTKSSALHSGTRIFLPIFAQSTSWHSLSLLIDGSYHKENVGSGLDRGQTMMGIPREICCPSFQQIFELFYREISIPQNTLQNLGVKCFPSMVRHRRPLALFVLLYFVTSTLTNKKKSCTL